jgi:hypothetical protein
MLSDLKTKIKQSIKKTFYRANRNPLSVKLFRREIEHRANLPFTDIHSLAKPINMFAPFTKEIHPANDWYGHATNLKKYLGLPLNYSFKFIMEHGLYLNNQVDQIDLESNLKSFVTYSQYRENILLKHRPHAFSIGPFIHYAESLLSPKEIEKERKRLGKSMLFFPAHSTPVIGMEFDADKLCKDIKKLSKGMDSVRICIYWKDVLMGRDKIYKEYGFECVTAGHMLDPNFLPRLKSLILISDLTASNIISSQAGFCIFLQKPHILINNRLELKTTKEWNKRIHESLESDGYVEVAREFSKKNFKISQIQKKLVQKYWGSDLTKTKKELKKIIGLAEKIAR